MKLFPWWAAPLNLFVLAKAPVHDHVRESRAAVDGARPAVARLERGPIFR
jgi:hypothetical protein